MNNRTLIENHSRKNFTEAYEKAKTLIEKKGFIDNSFSQELTSYFIEYGETVKQELSPNRVSSLKKVIEEFEINSIGVSRSDIEWDFEYKDFSNECEDYIVISYKIYKLTKIAKIESLVRNVMSDYDWDVEHSPKKALARLERVLKNS